MTQWHQETNGGKPGTGRTHRSTMRVGGAKYKLLPHGQAGVTGLLGDFGLPGPLATA